MRRPRRTKPLAWRRAPRLGAVLQHRMRPASGVVARQGQTLWAADSADSAQVISLSKYTASSRP